MPKTDKMMYGIMGCALNDIDRYGKTASLKLMEKIFDFIFSLNTVNMNTDDRISMVKNLVFVPVLKTYVEKKNEKNVVTKVVTSKEVEVVKMKNKSMNSTS